LNFGTGRGQRVKFDNEFFGPVTVNNFPNELENLKWENLTINGEFTSAQEFEHLAGFGISMQKFHHLKNCFNRHLKKDCPNEPVDIDSFFRRIKKGSKWFRKIFEYQPISRSTHFKGMQQVKTYCRITSTEFVNEECSSYNLSCWNTFSFPNRFKVFLFKFYNNILGTGDRVAHFNDETNPACIFCIRALNLPPPIESFSHIFYDCPTSTNIVMRFVEKYFNGEITRNQYFSGNFSPEKKVNQSIMLFINALRYCIWEAKLRKVSPSFPTIENETLYLLSYLMESNKKIKTNVLMSNFINVDGRRPADEGP